jgi:hypothetical protein
MKVETYEAISVDEQGGAIINEQVSEEALALIDALDLGGQKELLSERESGEEAVTTRIPYRQMTAEERAVFGTLFERRISLAKYNDGPIPLRVLQVAAHAMEMFDGIEVWCPEKGRDDPLLVGVKGGTEYNWAQTRVGGDRFILARWGEVLQPLEALRDKAREILTATAATNINETRAKLAAFEAGFRARIDVFLLTGKSHNEDLSISIGR